MRRSLATLAALATMTGTAILATAPSAYAGGYGCSGSQVGSYDLQGSDGVWSTSYLYYSSANGGTNCAVLVAKKWAGTRHYMSISMKVPGKSGPKENEGQFASYAGPVTQTGTNGHCISMILWENSPDNDHQAGRPVDNVACG
ncbi:hypothetical protein ACFYZ4_38515 [Streptomyces sp. NPDC001513]|uniref:hypothetical protein n=1 Tax=Streptomyces sp. NPDC001513 TaxID=3364580 RepID=UPI0036929221